VDLTRRRLDAESLDAYVGIPILYEVRTRFLADEYLRAGAWLEVPVLPERTKDYDLLESPADLPQVFDVANWWMLLAPGSAGAILAMRTSEFDMLEGREDLAILVDFRVRPSAKGLGLGTALLGAAIDLAKAEGCSEMRVETQDVNAVACRFYASRGARLLSVDPWGYGPGIDEAKLVWSWDLH
jgi:GNAT superfamily N-acetyltransferase